MSVAKSAPKSGMQVMFEGMLKSVLGEDGLQKTMKLFENINTGIGDVNAALSRIEAEQKAAQLRDENLSDRLGRMEKAAGIPLAD